MRASTPSSSAAAPPPSLAPAQFEQILQTVRDLFDLSDLSDLETSLEANPGTVTLDSLRGLRRAGFNRISFGVQSFDPGELRQLERIHDPFDVLNAVGWARQAGFENLNLDLIYGLPEQSLARWQANVKRAVELAPQHLSLYALTIEHGTPYGRWAARGLLPLPDPDLAADMYEWASDYLEGQGYEQYEISNWARPGFQCRHNLQYWRNQPYLGFGAGAHGCANDMRISNVLHIKTYLDRLSPNLPLSPDTPFPLSPATVTRTRSHPVCRNAGDHDAGIAPDSGRRFGAGLSPALRSGNAICFRQRDRRTGWIGTVGMGLPPSLLASPVPSSLGYPLPSPLGGGAGGLGAPYEAWTAAR